MTINCKDYPRNLLHGMTGQYADLVMGPNIYVHKCLMGKLSPFLASMFDTVDSKENMILVMPQVELSTVKKMVELIYTGRCSVTHAEIKKLNSLLNCLDMPIVIDHLSINTDAKEDQKMVGVKDQEDVPMMIDDLCVNMDINEDRKRGGSNQEFRNVSIKRLRSEAINSYHERSLRSTVKSEAVDSHHQERSLRSNLKNVVGKKELKLKKSNKVGGKIYRCKLCFLPLNMQSRFKVAHHMFTVHYKDKIQENLCGSLECSLCGKEFTSRSSVARHLGETHEVASAMYETDTESKLWRKSKNSQDTEKDVQKIEESKSENVDHTVDEQDIKTGRKRIRNSIYSLPCRHTVVNGIYVEVVHDVPAIEDLNLVTIESADIKVVDQTISSSSIPSRLLVHGRNSVPWKMYNEEYSDCVMGLVEKGMMKSIDKRCISTQENQFFHLWNEFILEYGYVGTIGRIHMSRVLERFIEERGKQVIQEKLYRQFVSHLVMLESEAVLPKGQMLRLAVKMQDVEFK